MRFVINNPVTAAFTGRKAECPKCDAKAVGNNSSTLLRWKQECTENTERFLEMQFKKPLSSFNQRDLRLVTQLCRKYMSPARAELLSNIKSFRNRVLLAARETSPGMFAPITMVEAERIWKEVGKMSDASRRRHSEDTLLLHLLPEEFIAKHLIATKAPRLTPFDYVLTLPQYATVKEIDDRLAALVDADEVELDDDGLVVLPERTWRRLRENKKLSEWPIAMQTRYGKPGMLVGKPQGRKPKPPPPPRVMRTQAVPREDILHTTPEREARRAANAVKPRPVPVKVTPKPKVETEDMDDLDSLLNNKPKARAAVPTPTHAMSVAETIAFINAKANEALLPGDMPRGRYSPITMWSSSDWLLVHKYREFIDRDWYAGNQAHIDKALRRFAKHTGETTAALGTNEFFDVLVDMTRVFDHAGV